LTDRPPADYQKSVKATYTVKSAIFHLSMVNIRPSTPNKAAAKRPPSILFHACSMDPDMLYFSSFRASDPYLAFTVGKKKIGLAVPMEFSRMEKESTFDEVLLLPEIREGAARRFNLKKGVVPDDGQVVKHLAELYGIREFRIGSRFPAGLAFKMKDAGLRITVAENGNLLPQRECKTASEVEALRKGNRASAAGFKAVTRTLTEAKIRDGFVVHNGSVLTSERLREIISQATLAEGAVSLDTIAASGDQACDCHNAGTGPIRAGELIVVDIFPRRIEDGYWGDMTRTYLKGKASDAQRRLVRTVKRGHELGVRLIRPGVTGGKVQEAVEAFFAKEGYKTVKNSREPEGFFHALGHGVGLEVHEGPAIRPGAKQRLRKGMVVTVEPGLYYRGLGGVRIEDMVHVIGGGNELISSAPYKWEIP
jgi:Xaa-Pro aminopeptidase